MIATSVFGLNARTGPTTKWTQWSKRTRSQRGERVSPRIWSPDSRLHSKLGPRYSESRTYTRRLRSEYGKDSQRPVDGWLTIFLGVKCFLLSPSLRDYCRQKGIKDRPDYDVVVCSVGPRRRPVLTRNTWGGATRPGLRVSPAPPPFHDGRRKMCRVSVSLPPAFVWVVKPR